MTATTGGARRARWAAQLALGVLLGGLWFLAGGGSEPAAAAACTNTPNYGTHYNCSIGASGEVDAFTISGSTGDHIRIRVVETSGNLFALHEVRVGGGTLCAQTGAEETTCQLASGANHNLRVTGNGTSTGNYTLWIQNLDAPVGCTTLAAGTLRTTGTNVNAVAEEDCWRFSTGAANQRMRFRVMETASLTATMEVVGPGGTTVCAQTTAETLDCVLPSAGTHWLHVHAVGTGTGTYNLYRQVLNAPTGCTTIAADSLTATSIGVAGEVDCYRFSGPNGSRWRIRVVETSGNLFALQEVTRPNGTVRCPNTGAEETTCVFDINTAHTLFVSGNGTSTGNYSLRLQRLDNPAGCSSLPNGALTTTGNIAAAADGNCFTFGNSTSGHRLRFRIMETSSVTVSMEVVAPDGTTVCAATTAETLDCQLTTTGAHTLHVVGIGAGTGTYNVYRQNLSSPAGCTTISPGTVNPGSIGAAGEVDCYRFSGPNGSQWRIRVLETSGNLFALQEVTRPNGTVRCATTGAESITCVFDTNTAHTLLVSGNGTSTGNYRFHLQRLDNPSGCSSLPAGTLHTNGNINSAADVDCRSFGNPTAGSRMRFRIMETSAVTAEMEVVGPDGLPVCVASSAEIVDCTLPATGTHWLHVRGIGTGTGTYNLYRQILSNPTGCTTIAANSLTNAGIAVAGEVDCYRFTGPNGSRWRIRVLETSGNLFALQEVTRPNGTVVCPNTGAESVTCTFDTNTAHTLLISGNGTSTGNYSLHLQRLSNPAGCSSLPNGALTTTGNINSAADADCWTFSTSVANHRMRFRLMETSSVTASMEVIAPDGTTACAQTSAETLDCVLPTATSYTLNVTGVGTGTGTYNLYRQNLSAPAGCTTISPGNTAGSIGAAGEVDCYRFSASNGQTRQVTVTETSGTLFALQEVVRPNGTTVCPATGAQTVQCVIDVNGNHTIYVSGNGTSTGNYTLGLG